MAVRIDQLPTTVIEVGQGSVLPVVVGGSTVRKTASELAIAFGAVYNVRLFGAVGDGVFDDTAAIQAAIAACAAAGGGIVLFPRGTYLISATLTVPSFVALYGVGGAYRSTEYGIDPGNVASTIKHPAAAFTMLKNADATNGNSSIELRGLRFDQTGETGDNPIILFDKVRRSIISDCYLKGAATTSRYGLRHTNSSEHNAIVLSNLEGCGIHSDGAANRLLIRESEIAAGGIKLTGGFDHMIMDCDLYNDGVSGSFAPYPDIITLVSVTGCLVRGNQIAASLNHGILCGAGVTRSSIVSNQVKSSSRQTAGVWSGIALDSNVPASPTENNVIANNVCWDPLGGAGTQAYGISVSSSSGSQTNGNVFAGNVLTGNRIGPAVQTAGLVNIWRDNVGSAAQTVASAATIAVPGGAEFVTVSGTTTITSVTAGYAGQQVTLMFSGALTFTDGSNLKLAGNLVTTADDTITLVCDGTNWFEVCRSVN